MMLNITATTRATTAKLTKATAATITVKSGARP